MGSKVTLVSLLALTIFMTVSALEPFCQPVSTNINDPNSLPKFPDEFQTRVAITSPDDRDTREATLIYDGKNKRAELILTDFEKTTRKIYLYDEDKIYVVETSNTLKCSIQRISDDTDHLLFGLVNNNMAPANEVFHFNNGNPLLSMGTTQKRGINVVQYQSCQEDRKFQASFNVDFYFTSPEHQQAIVFDQNFKQVLVEMYVNGFRYTGGDTVQSATQKTNFKRLYSFYEFRSKVERIDDLYRQPPGIYCDGQFEDKMPKPTIPDDFHFVLESVNSNSKLVETFWSHYSKTLNAFQYEFEPNPEVVDDADPFGADPRSFIVDFTGGVVYESNKRTGECRFIAIGSDGLLGKGLIKQIDSQFGKSIELVSPNEFFYIDKEAYYAGTRIERGILCDVYISKRVGNDGAEYLVETYILNKKYETYQSIEQEESVVPISTHLIVNPGFKDEVTTIQHYFDFDSASNRVMFDVSDCFNGRDKIRFGVKFNYPPGLYQFSFLDSYGDLVDDAFEDTMLKVFSQFGNVSPLRIIYPRVEANARGFFIYSGITAFPPPISHFVSMENSKVDLTRAQYVIATSSAENCAAVCLNDSAYSAAGVGFQCLSFDYCQDPKDQSYSCSFYNISFGTDPTLIVPVDSAASATAAQCTHFSKSIVKTDGINTDILFNAIKEAVSVRKSFSFEVTSDNRNSKATFTGVDIFTINNDADVDNPTRGSQESGGSTTFASRFYAYQSNRDLNGALLLRDPNFSLRNKTALTLDECARLCTDEPAFECHTMSYSDRQNDCKWSSFDVISEDNATAIEPFISIAFGYTVYARRQLTDYIQIQSRVSTDFNDYKVIEEVDSAGRCAALCNTETEFPCRSFNLCDKTRAPRATYRCLLSKTSLYSHTKRSNLTYAPVCTHFTKRGSLDFQRVPNTRLSVQPRTVYFNVTLEGCSEYCILEDAYLCRSFDYAYSAGYVSNECRLYSQNLKDKHIDLGVREANMTTHFSRLRYTRDGKVFDVEADFRKEFDGAVKFYGGTVFMVVLTISIGGFLLGAMFAFLFMKVKDREDVMLPVMKFVNPNYDNDKSAGDS